MIRRIAILGVNGQVGAELALSLYSQPGCEIVGFLRAEYGAVLCRLAGIRYRILDAGVDLREFDTVVDAAIPSGDNSLLGTQIRALIDRNLAAMKPGATYVYLSSIMAMGMPASATIARAHRIARTPYSVAKRSAERESLRLGEARGVRVVAIRLGQVHGVVQSATQDFVDKFSRPEVWVNGGPDDLLTTVFVAELADFLGHGHEQDLKPGIYYGVSQPQWRQKDFFEYVCRRYGCSARVQYGMPVESPTIQRRMIALAEAYILGSIPSVAIAVKGRYRSRQAALPVQVGDDNQLLNLLGQTPGPGLPSALERADLERREILVSNILDDTLARATA